MSIEPIHPAPSPVPSRLGQATAVEQSRAVAEVAAAVQVAQLCPRDVRAATEEMRRACAHPKLAERAFFRYNRGDGIVTGASVYLARELARCWGNVQSGVSELRRDDEHGQSEMQAWAWDVQTNSRTSTTFIVPHARDTKKGRKELTDLRDVYENNANNGARRLREMILGLLPQWFVEEAKDICTDTIRAGNGKPLGERITEAVEAFEAEFRITRARLEQRIGHPSAAWTAHDVATLRVIFTSLRRGEIQVEDEFPTERTASVTAADLGVPPAPAAQPAPAAAPAPAVEDPGASSPDPEASSTAPLTSRQWRAINARFVELAVVGDGQSAKRRDVMCHIIGRQISSPDDLTEQDGVTILANLAEPTGPDIVAEVTGIGAPVEDEQPVQAEQDDQAAAGQAHLEAEAEQRAAADDGDPYANYDPSLELGGAEAAAEGQ